LGVEKALVGVLVIAMVIALVYGVFKWRQMQTRDDANSPPKASGSRPVVVSGCLNQAHRQT
jgi:hypothetical protein